MSLWESVDKAEMSMEMGPLPEGVYTAEVTDVEVGDDLFEAKYSVEFTVKEGEYTGRKCWWSGSLTQEKIEKYPNMLTMVKAQVCRLAGVDSTEGKPIELLAGCLHSTVLIEVKHNVSKTNGKTYTNVWVKEKLG